MITIPNDLWDRMLGEFASERRKVEQVCYFDGVVDAVKGDGVVTTLTIPNARLGPGRFEVKAEAMSQAGKHLRAHRLKRLAQIHTHPTAWVGHSPWDDEMAYSKIPGSISIVLPNYAHANPRLEDAGVHLRTDTGWQQLEPHEVQQYLRVVPGFLDFRPTSQKQNEEEHIKPTQRQSWWNISRFWRG